MRVACNYNWAENVGKCGMCTTFLVHEIPQILGMKSVLQDNNHIVMKYYTGWLGTVNFLSMNPLASI